MSATTTGRSVAAEVWRNYRLAFQELSVRAHRLAELRASSISDHASIDAAIAEFERCRARYTAFRDALADLLLTTARASTGRLHPMNRTDDPTSSVRRVAQLLWEFDGRRDGQAENDWYRAEAIVRSVSR